MVGISVRINPKVEEQIRMISEEYDFTTDTIRNLAILLGIIQLKILLKSRLTVTYLERLYKNLLEEISNG